MSAEEADPDAPATARWSPSSASDVYHTAELPAPPARRHGGGAGGAQPAHAQRQVEMYQAGEVDYLVATDAIGMGLNMDVDHVAFARLVKFDGQTPRHLRATEIAQIAGRAGRHMSDGTFRHDRRRRRHRRGRGRGGGETTSSSRLRHLMWRNSDLDFRDPKALIASLESRPPVPDLRRAPEADDHLSLRLLGPRPGPGAPRRRQPGGHPPALGHLPDSGFPEDADGRPCPTAGAGVWDQLTGPDGRLDPDWVGAARSTGWTAATATSTRWSSGSPISAPGPSSRTAPSGWPSRAIGSSAPGAIEDRLSDATARPLDPAVRRSALGHAGQDAGGRQGPAVGSVAGSGEVLVEGAFVGRLEGFRVCARCRGAWRGRGCPPADERAARRALRPEIAGRVKRLEAEDDRCRLRPRRRRHRPLARRGGRPAGGRRGAPGAAGRAAAQRPPGAVGP